jgi:pyruvate,water dikinase
MPIFSHPSSGVGQWSHRSAVGCDYLIFPDPKSKRVFSAHLNCPGLIEIKGLAPFSGLEFDPPRRNLRMPQSLYVRWFGDIRLDDVALVGGKTASLGELYSTLSGHDIRVPNGFAITARAYYDALTAADAWGSLHGLLDGLEKTDVDRLKTCAAKARKIVYEATGRPDLRNEAITAYRLLEKQYGDGVAVAVRSSATAEDLPNASFAGQHESFLNVRDEDDLFEACRRCFASIFTDRAISYRIDNRFDHFKVGLSVGVMKMVRADSAASGVTFTIDTESGFRDVVFVTGVYGLGENIVQGTVDPDEFYIHKPTFRAGHRAVLSRSLGGKQMRMVYAGNGGTRNIRVPKSDRARFCLTDLEVLKLAGDAIKIEEHYSAKAGHSMPMDIEWAKDGEDGQLYIIQARPETVASQRAPTAIETFALVSTGAVLVEGKAVGEEIATGPVRVIASARQLADFKQGEVLVAESTTPDWEPVMKIAAAIVTERGGRTCHAAIVARELGVPAIVGAQGARSVLKNRRKVTVSCAEGEVGHVYDGVLEVRTTRLALSDLKRPKTAIMLNLGNPELAFKTAMLPNDGVGLARMEFIISEHIKVHPMALVEPDRIASKAARTEISQLVSSYASAADYFIEKLSEGIGTIAAAFYPKPVIVRLSDFKTNEYARLLGGEAFEPKEENPMLGFRGAARYAHPAYAAGFALECAALRRVRNDMGLINVRVMVPFCRRVEEGRRVIEAMASHGLKRGENELEIYVMCEIPNNVIQIDEFAELFDGFSIGSNDLTQLTLGVDRDSQIVAFDFDERDPGMLEMLRLAVAGAKRNGRHVGICGEAPANFPEIARYLAELGIDSISVNPSSILRTMQVVREAEDARAHASVAAE